MQYVFYNEPSCLKWWLGFFCWMERGSLKFKANSLFIFSVTFLIFISFSFSARGTDVGGIIGTNTTWDIAGSPYNLKSNVQIAENVALTIEPGVIVNGGSDAEYFRFQLWGHINAIGSNSLKIIFNDIR